MQHSDAASEALYKVDEETLLERPKPVFERYYQRHGFMPGGKPGEHMYLFQHTNKLCVMGLAQGHPIVAEGKVVTKIDFSVTDKTDRLKNAPTGKRKRNTQMLTATCPLCVVTCSDGSVYRIFSGVKAALFEVNERLVDNPDLMRTQAMADGYLAIVSPKRDHNEGIFDGMLDHEEYQRYLAAPNAEAAAAIAAEAAAACEAAQVAAKAARAAKGGSKEKKERRAAKRMQAGDAESGEAGEGGEAGKAASDMEEDGDGNGDDQDAEPELDEA